MTYVQIIFAEIIGGGICIRRIFEKQRWRLQREMQKIRATSPRISSPTLQARSSVTEICFPNKVK